MTVPRSAADVLADHVTLEVECIDLSLSVYIPKLVYPAEVVGLFKGHRDMPLASGALMDPISKDLVASVHRLIRDEGVDLVQLAKGQRRDDVATRTHVISRLRRDAALFEAAPPHTNKRGRPRTKGARLADLATLAAQAPAREWAEVTLDCRGRAVRSAVWSRQVLWHGVDPRSLVTSSCSRTRPGASRSTPS